MRGKYIWNLSIFAVSCRCLALGFRCKSGTTTEISLKWLRCSCCKPALLLFLLSPPCVFQRLFPSPLSLTQRASVSSCHQLRVAGTVIHLFIHLLLMLILRNKWKYNIWPIHFLTNMRKAMCAQVACDIFPATQMHLVSVIRWYIREMKLLVSFLHAAFCSTHFQSFRAQGLRLNWKQKNRQIQKD